MHEPSSRYAAGLVHPRPAVAPPGTRAPLLLAALAALLLAARAPVALAQEPPTPAAAILGIVTDTAGTPIAGAIVGVLPSSGRTESNAAGRFELAGLAAGPHLVAVRKLGYAPLHFEVDLGAGERLALRLRLERTDAQELSEVRIEADRIAQRLPRVAQRRDAGRGSVVTGAELREIADHMPNVRDAIDWLPELRREQGHAASRCDVYVDGRKVPKERGEDMPLDFWASFDEIEAVEVHRDRYHVGRALLDYEFGSAENRRECAVLIWTKYIHLRPGRQDAGYREDPAARELRERTARLLAEQRARERADTTTRATGTLTGFVVDAEQRPLAGATVTLPDAAGRPGQALRAVTDSTGAFMIPEVPVGLVVVRVERTGCPAVLAHAMIEAGARAVRMVTVCASRPEDE